VGQTIISWATQTVNVVTGCSKPIETDPDTQRRFISPECVHCYAEALSLKRGWSKKPWTEVNAADNVILHPERFKEFARIPVKPVHLLPSQRERFFVCSMGDTFHRQVPDWFLEQLWAWLTKYQHIYQMLTKRPERAADWPGPWPDHIWLGTTCGHPGTKHRIEHLRRSAAKVRFISAEPLLGSLLPIDLTGIHQVIVGGESGPGFRPMQMQWARELRDECERQQVAYFYKQDAAWRTEIRCYLVEKDGRCVQYRQFPGEMTPPVEIAPDSEKYHREHFPILR
jgi:protein gp37